MIIRASEEQGSFTPRRNKADRRIKAAPVSNEKSGRIVFWVGIRVEGDEGGREEHQMRKDTKN